METEEKGEETRRKERFLFFFVLFSVISHSHSIVHSIRIPQKERKGILFWNVIKRSKERFGVGRELEYK